MESAESTMPETIGFTIDDAINKIILPELQMFPALFSRNAAPETVNRVKAFIQDERNQDVVYAKMKNWLLGAQERGDLPEGWKSQNAFERYFRAEAKRVIFLDEMATQIEECGRDFYVHTILGLPREAASEKAERQAKAAQREANATLMTDPAMQERAKTAIDNIVKRENKKETGRKRTIGASILTGIAALTIGYFSMFGTGKPAGGEEIKTHVQKPEITQISTAPQPKNFYNDILSDNELIVNLSGRGYAKDENYTQGINVNFQKGYVKLMDSLEEKIGKDPNAGQYMLVARYTYRDADGKVHSNSDINRIKGGKAFFNLHNIGVEKGKDGRIEVGVVEAYKVRNDNGKYTVDMKYLASDAQDSGQYYANRDAAQGKTELKKGSDKDIKGASIIAQHDIRADATEQASANLENAVATSSQNSWYSTMQEREQLRKEQPVSYRMIAKDIVQDAPIRA